LPGKPEKGVTPTNGMKAKEHQIPEKVKWKLEKANFNPLIGVGTCKGNPKTKGRRRKLNVEFPTGRNWFQV